MNTPLINPNSNDTKLYIVLKISVEFDENTVSSVLLIELTEVKKYIFEPIINLVTSVSI